MVFSLSLRQESPTDETAGAVFTCDPVNDSYTRLLFNFKSIIDLLKFLKVNFDFLGDAFGR